MAGGCLKPSVLDRSYRLMTVSASSRNSLKPHLFGTSITSTHEICNSTVCHVLQSRAQIRDCGKLRTRHTSLLLHNAAGAHGVPHRRNGDTHTPTQFGPHLTSVDWILHTRPPPTTTPLPEFVDHDSHSILQTFPSRAPLKP